MQREVIDARGPTDWGATAEGRKLRARILNGIESGLRKRNGLPMGRRARDELGDYASALGLSREAAQDRVNLQGHALIAFEHDLVREGAAAPAAPPRRWTDARGPTNWSRDTEAKRLRASLFSAINRRVLTGTNGADRWLWDNSAMSEGNRPR